MARNTPLRPAMNVETTSQLSLWWDPAMLFDGLRLDNLVVWPDGERCCSCTRSMKPNTSDDPRVSQSS